MVPRFSIVGDPSFSFNHLGFNRDVWKESVMFKGMFSGGLKLMGMFLHTLIVILMYSLPLFY